MNKSQKIIIVDYDMGNLGSIVNMLKKLGVRVQVTKDKNKIKFADKLILPGDGAFDTGMKNLEKFGLLNIINKKALIEKVPILGVCIGIQLFSQKSEEGKLAGLSWINAQTIRFKINNKSNNLKIPHMGWNTIKIIRPSILLKNLTKNSRFYFVHSYHLLCKEVNDIVATTEHGYYFPAVIEKGNLFGVQFHPEKSHKFGLMLYDNFLKL